MLRRVAALAVVLFAVVLPAVGPAAAAPEDGVKCPETRANLAGQRIAEGDKLPDLTCADLHGAVFDDLDLVQVTFDGADAHGASFRHARLGQADFRGADLRDANFESAELAQAHLDGADARGARFAHATLDQADLTRADLRGADLLSASVVQAEFVDADLRSAQIWWTDSTQADASGARVDITDLRNFQLGLLVVVAGLVLLVRAVVAALRRRGTRPATLLGTLLPAAIFFGAGAFLRVTVGMLFPLLLVVWWYPLLVGAALVLIGGLVRWLASRPAPPDPTPFGSSAPTGFEALS
ncbi:pentapeptide repeat-containing protein [Dactylosporangium sp. CA-092794]|uniref:pentapeptide repeat-containing protein n=1 Tax=Dactylosporangium sp. CA-092794 TaxID=3239929 RepID=UPI003D8B26E4